MTIQGLIDAEIQIGVTRLNGEDNKKELSKDKKGSWEWKYCSVARTVVRLWWLFKFVVALFENIVDQPTYDMVKCCKEAYKTALAEHHPWALKNAAKVAMGLVGSRDGVGKKLRLTNLQ